MKITKNYLRKLIKESIKEGFGDDPATAYIITDEGSYHPAEPIVIFNDFQKAKQVAENMGNEAPDSYEAYVVVYKVELTEEKQVYKYQ
jgi:hypothetical protein